MTKLFLHEAIAVVLLSIKERQASVETIAEIINERRLYIRKDQKNIPAYQIMQRVKLSKGHYHYLFEWINPNIVRLRNME
jgi:predicted transcriptional regulator